MTTDIIAMSEFTAPTKSHLNTVSTGNIMTRSQPKTTTTPKTKSTLHSATAMSRDASHDASTGTELAHCPWPFDPNDTSPLAWWRTMPAYRLHDTERVVLHEALSKVAVLGRCEWVGAMRGDAAASIAVALEVLPIADVTLQVDLAFSALLLNALDGNAAAALMLSHVLRQMKLDHPFGKELAVSWLVSNLRGALKTRKPATRKSGRAKPVVVRDTTALPLGMGA